MGRGNPQREVGGAVARGGEDRDHAERRTPQRRRPRHAVGGIEQGHEADGEHGDGRIRTELGHVPVGRPAPRCSVMEGEAGAGGEHGEDQDHLHRYRPEVGDRRVVGREPTRRQGRECVSHRVVGGQAGNEERSDGGRRESAIDDPQTLGRLTHPRAETVRGRAGRLGLDQLQASDAEEREHRHRQHDHAHPAVPLGHLAPEEDPGTVAFDGRQHRRARGGEPGNGFEDGVIRTVEGPGQQERDGSGERGDHPRPRHGGERRRRRHRPGNRRRAPRDGAAPSHERRRSEQVVDVVAAVDRLDEGR